MFAFEEGRSLHQVLARQGADALAVIEPEVVGGERENVPEVEVCVENMDEVTGCGLVSRREQS